MARDIQAAADQTTIVSSSPKHSQVPISSVPHSIIMKSSANTAAKLSTPKKEASEGSGNSVHLRVSRSEASKHTRKLVHSFPESPVEKPIEEQSLAIDSTFLQRLSPVDTADSYTQPDYRRSCCQLYVPTIASAESFTQLDHTRSSGQLYTLSKAESHTEPDCSRSSDQLYVPESFTQPDRCSSSGRLYMPTNIYAESSMNPDHSRSSGQLHMSTNTADSVIKVLLHFDQSRLRVRLVRATNLPKEFHKGRYCDPFVVLHLEPSREETFQSKVIKGTSDPEFRQTFQFERMSVECIKLQTLVLRIYNRALNNKTIGKVYLPINDIELDGSSMKKKITNTEEMEVNTYAVFTFHLIRSVIFNCDTFNLCRATTRVIYFYHWSMIPHHTLWLV